MKYGLSLPTDYPMTDERQMRMTTNIAVGHCATERADAAHDAVRFVGTAVLDIEAFVKRYPYVEPAKIKRALTKLRTLEREFDAIADGEKHRAIAQPDFAGSNEWGGEIRQLRRAAK